MPEVSRAQFLKANPNQQALPGMENVSHPGAALLRQGYHFKHEREDIDTPDLDGDLMHAQIHTLRVHSPEGNTAGYMQWAGKISVPKRFAGAKPGEIDMIEVHPDHQHQGIATAMYGVGRQMARIKPQHSTQRTDEGDAWSKTTTDKFGGRVPKKNTFPQRRS